jgi:hypothetical protein
VLEIVQHQQEIPLVGDFHDLIQRVPVALFPQTQCPRNSRQQECGVADHRKVNEADGISLGAGSFGHGQRHSRLADSSGASQRQQAHPGLLQEFPCGAALLGAPDQLRGRSWERCQPPVPGMLRGLDVTSIALPRELQEVCAVVIAE